MKPEEQRIKIALACGWTHVKPWPYFGRSPNQPEVVGRHPDIGDDQCNYPIDDVWCCPVPPYTTCLNAMHEAEKVLLTSIAACEAFQSHLEDVMARRLNASSQCEWRVWHAKAPQRCEALLKALNQWTLTDED